MEFLKTCCNFFLICFVENAVSFHLAYICCSRSKNWLQSITLQSDLGLNLVNFFAFSVSMTTSKAATKPGGEIRYNFLFRSVRCSKGSLYYFQKLWNSDTFYAVTAFIWSRGDEPICYRGPLCQLPLSKRAAQLFSHTMKPVKNEKNCSSTETNNKRK